MRRDKGLTTPTLCSFKLIGIIQATYDACVDIGRNLARALGAEKVEALREAFQDH